VLLIEVASASVDVATTSSRLAKIARLAELLGAAPDDEVATVVAWLSGELPQRQIGVGWAGLRDLPAPATGPTLTVLGVDAAFSAIKATAGKGSQASRASQVAAIFAAATATEQSFLRGLLSGELRQGAQRGVMADAVAKATELPATAVRRAAMLGGDLPGVIVAARSGGAEALAAYRLEVGRPVLPMLAQTAGSLTEGLTKIGGHAIIDAKLDGVRLQVHRDGDEVRLFTRTLDDVTSRLPELVDYVRSLPVTRFVADGEAIALRPDGRPHAFQVTASRLGRRAADSSQIPLRLFLFDVLHVDDRDLLDEPTTARLDALDRVVPPVHRIERIDTTDEQQAMAFVEATLAAGHEGVMLKAPDVPYEAGRRGAGWLKLKPVHTLDLVVLAVEWGSGRRKGYLSNIHLGARDPETGSFVMLGKTFKGMTDEMLAWQTRRFTELADGPTDAWVVPLKPVQVVEIAFDGIQTSSRYPAGMALRFARVIRYRDDKLADEADTVDTVHMLHRS
jgi:DNA ligase-1